MDIGEKEKTIFVPLPVPVRPIKIPEREPVPVRRTAPERREPVPVRREESLKETFRNIGFEVSEIPSACPYCGMPLEQDDHACLHCPSHGLIYCA
jgi:hypothetical protein